MAACLRVVLAALVLVVSLASSAVAQTPWPKVVIRTGALLADIGSDVRVDGTAGAEGTSINLNDDLGFQNQTTTFFIDGIWRISHRNRLLASYEGIRRSTTRSVLPRTITFRDTTFTVGTETQAYCDTFYISADYGFAFVARPTVEVGVTLGVTVMRIHSGIDIAVAVTSGQSVSRDLVENTRFDVPIPLPGFFVNIRPHPRVTIIGSTRIIKATIGDITASLAEAKGGVDVVIGRGVGVGGAYYFNKSTVDRQQSSRSGRIEYSFNGPQAYVVFAF